MMKLPYANIRSVRFVVSINAGPVTGTAYRWKLQSTWTVEYSTFPLQFSLSYFVEDFHVAINFWQALVSCATKPAFQRQNKMDTLCSDCSVE